MPYNLTSPNGIVEPCDVRLLDKWFDLDLTQIPDGAEKAVLRIVATNLDSFVRWGDKPVLLWSGCDRIPPAGERQKYFQYPEKIKKLARVRNVRLDGRPNGPAIASFFAVGRESARAIWKFKRVVNPPSLLWKISVLRTQ